MKTLTELSGSVIRTAAAAITDARRSLPKEEVPAVAEAPEAPRREAPQQEASQQEAPQLEATQLEATQLEAPQEPAQQAAKVSGAAAEAAPVGGAPTPPVATPEPKPEPESEAVKAALDEAVAKATGFSGARLAMLRAAVEIAGRRSEDVRLVRVFGLEERLSGAHAVGEHQYVIDFFPRDMKQVAAVPKDKHGRGGGRRGAGRGGGERGAKGSATGGFSMDSLRDDRKNERGGRGRPGGGRRPGGGGPAGGGGAGGSPGGNPKE